MKKLIHFLFILTFFRINVFAQTKTENTIHIEEKVFNWIDKHFVIADTLTNTFLSQLKNSIHWSNPAISFNSYNERQIAFTLKPGIHTNGRTSKRSSSFLLITENRKGEISQGHIVKLTPDLLNVER